MLERGERRLLACRGPDAATYVHDQLTNDVESLEPGHGCYAALLDRKAHMQADLRVLRIAADELLLDTEQAGRDALGVHLGTYRVGRDVDFENLAEGHTVLSVIGPATADRHRRRTPCAGARAPRGRDRRRRRTRRGNRRRHRPDLRAGRPGGDRGGARGRGGREGGSGGRRDRARRVRPAAVRPRHDHRHDSPGGGDQRARRQLHKGCYIGQETVARLHYRGKPNRHLRGLRLSGQVEPGAVVRLGDRELGTVGTAVLSPAHGPIALAILRREAEPGSTVEIDANGATVEAGVVELPFV